MANITPTQVLTGYALLAQNDPAPAQGIFVPLTTITGLSAAEANATNGDGRKLIAGLMESINTALTALPNNAKPVYLTVAKAQPSGVALGQINQTFSVTVRYQSEFGQIVEVAPEPVSS